MVTDHSLDTELQFIGDACFAFLIDDPEELMRFMTHAGYDPLSLKEALGTHTLTLAMIAHFANYEPSLLAMCANAHIDAARFNQAWRRLNAQTDG